MAAHVFRDDDLGFVTWVAENPDGYVLNIQRGLSAADARLHTATCGHLARAIEALESHQRHLTAAYIKLCSRSIGELDAWAAKQIGSEIRRCPSCQVPGQVTSEHRGPSDKGPAVSEPNASDLSYRITVSSNEVCMDAPRFLPLERLDQQQLHARTRLHDALAGLTAGPGQVLHASYSGFRPPNSDVENLVLYNADSAGANIARASSFGVRFELDSQSQDALCRYRYRLVAVTEPLVSWRLGPRMIRFAGVDLGSFRIEHRLAQTWMAIHNTCLDTDEPQPSLNEPSVCFLNCPCRRQLRWASSLNW